MSGMTYGPRAVTAAPDVRTVCGVMEIAVQEREDRSGGGV